MNLRKFLLLHLCFFFVVLKTFSQAQVVDEPKRRAEASKLPENIDFWSDYPSDILAQAIVDRMEEEELLSQVLMFGWAGVEPSALLNSWVSERGLGSVKVFGWNTDNIQQVARSINSLQKRASDRKFKIPLFVATDQEGGWIRHVKGETSETPGNMAIGASGYPYDAYYSSYYINKEIWALGINMNFAPSVDLYTNLDSTVIGPRSFGEKAWNVSVLGGAFMQGSIDAGVIPTAKHFPGHGDTSIDSHGRLPIIDADMALLQSRELVPFKYLSNAQIPAIMSGHLSFPQVESDGTPASLSHKWLTDILRVQMGYKGLIITDDMMMVGAWSFAGNLSNAVSMALEAGNDIIISSSTAGLNDGLWTKNLERMRGDNAFRERVKDAAYRVLCAKLDYFKGKNHAPLYPEAGSISKYIPDKEGQKFFLSQACRSVSVLKKGSLLPYKPSNKERILLVGPFQIFYDEGKKRYPSASTYHFSYDLKSDMSNADSYNASSLGAVIQGYDTIIVNVYDNHSAQIAQKLKGYNKRVIILSSMSPVFVLSGFDWADTILCGYSYSDFSYEALFGALNGEFEPKGKIPLKLN